MPSSYDMTPYFASSRELARSSALLFDTTHAFSPSVTGSRDFGTRLPRSMFSSNDSSFVVVSTSAMLKIDTSITLPRKISVNSRI